MLYFDKGIKLYILLDANYTTRLFLKDTKHVVKAPGYSTRIHMVTSSSSGCSIFNPVPCCGAWEISGERPK